MKEVVLNTQNLSKHYGSVKAVCNVNFSLEKGRVHAIIGANGAGKSTFVKLIFGEISPTSGKIFIKGKEAKLHSPNEAMQNGIAMVSQDFGLINTMTIAENLAINNAGGRKQVLFSLERTKYAVKKILSSLSLNINIDQYVSELTVSEKQLVSIAKALSIQADVIIFDEPTSVLDSNSFIMLKNLIRKLQSFNKSIIYITHKIDEVFEVADFVSVFKDSEIVFTNEVSKTKKTDLLAYFNIIPQETPSDLSKEEKPIILLIENLSTHHVKEISFSVYKGETVGIIADNNSYAVELAKAIYGLNKKLSGTVKINNIEVSNTYEHKKQKSGFISEDRRVDGIFNELSVNDNIGLLQFKETSKAGLINNNSIKKNTIQKIQSFGIKCKSILQPASELSGGNQQKILFARWMSFDFELLILIEPTAGIDLSGKSEIYSIIFDLKKKGKSFIIISSDFDEIKRLCDRVISLEEYICNDNKIKLIQRQLGSI